MGIIWDNSSRSYITCPGIPSIYPPYITLYPSISPYTSLHISLSAGPGRYIWSWSAAVLAWFAKVTGLEAGVLDGIK